MPTDYLTETGWEKGTLSTDTHFDADTPASGKLDVAHYTSLAATPGLPAPYRGAYCMRADLSVSTAECSVQETATWDIALNGTMYFRFMFWFGGRGSQVPVMADTDSFAIFWLESGSAVHEVTIGINYTDANGYRLYNSKLANEAGATFAPFSLNKWHSIEVFVNLDAGAGNDGTLDVFLDGNGLTQLTALDQLAVASGFMGITGQDAGTTAGICLFDQVIADDVRIHPPFMRYPQDMLLTASGHAFVGPGIVDNATLISGNGTDCVMTIYDTDTGITSNATRTRVELRNTTAFETVDPAGMPIHLIRGCYVEMAGTTPNAMLKIRRAVGYGSDGAMRTYASKRKAYKQDT